jgi:hypothetical protein
MPTKGTTVVSSAAHLQRSCVAACLLSAECFLRLLVACSMLLLSSVSTKSGKLDLPSSLATEFKPALELALQLSES